MSETYSAKKSAGKGVSASWVTALALFLGVKLAAAAGIPVEPAVILAGAAIGALRNGVKFAARKLRSKKA
jgi:hypothetical protein